jgi:hypothetical protein
MNKSTRAIENKIDELEQKVKEPNKAPIAVRHSDGTLTDLEGNSVDGTFTKMCFEFPPEMIEYWGIVEEPYPWDSDNDTPEGNPWVIDNDKANNRE